MAKFAGKNIETFFLFHVFFLKTADDHARRGRSQKELMEKAETFLTRSAAEKYVPAIMSPGVSR